MTDTILTKLQIEDLFFSLTMQILGLDPAAPANKSRIRMTWPTGGSPAWEIGEDVTFLLVNYDDDPVTRQMEVSYAESDADYADQSTSYTRVLRIDWICYGPNSFGDADTIRAGLFSAAMKLQLTAANLALITDVSMPTRTPELYNGQWWERSSLTARFNEFVVRHSTVPYIKAADVQILKG
jgi:hypothetical protein